MGHPNAVATQQVAAEIRAELARKQVTQTQLAEATGRSQAYWSRRLSGDHNLSVGDIAAVAELLEVPVRTFFDAVTEPTAVGA